MLEIGSSKAEKVKAAGPSDQTMIDGVADTDTSQQDYSNRVGAVLKDKLLLCVGVNFVMDASIRKPHCSCAMHISHQNREEQRYYKMMRTCVRSVTLVGHCPYLEDTLPLIISIRSIGNNH